MRRAGTILACLGLLAASATVLAAGWRHLSAQLAALPGNPATALLLRGGVPGEVAFERLLRSRERALARLPSAAWEVERGAAYLVRAMQAARAGGDPGPLLGQARDRLRAGLARAPADSAGWFWLAAVESLREDWPSAIAALRLSFAATPHDDEIAVARALIGLSAWPWLDGDLRPKVVRGLTLAVERQPEELVLHAEDLGRLKELRAALLPDPIATARLADAERQLQGPL